MKQRITYVLPEHDRVDASNIHVEKDSLTFDRAAEATKEWRFTIGWNELPNEITQMLEATHELHIRWTTPKPYIARTPLLARLPAGLHVFFTPRSKDVEVPICGLLRRQLGFYTAKCYSVSESFSRQPILSERFSAASTYQYFSFQQTADGLPAAFLKLVCNGTAPGLRDCDAVLEELKHASTIDVDFDAISHAVILTVMWPPKTADSGSARSHSTIRQASPQDTIEVGVLHPEATTEPEELALGGFLTVVGETDHPSITLFSFPARHHQLPSNTSSTFLTRFQQPTGLHPKLDLVLPRATLSPPKTACSLHAYWTLPSALFVDRYQLADQLFLRSQNLVKLHSLSGEQDLEAPDWVVKQWGSAALLELATPPSSSRSNGEWIVTIPTHLRYLNKTQDLSGEGLAPLEVPWPQVFWACEAEEGLKMATNPFDKVNLGYDGLFGPKTMFYHFNSGGDKTVEVLKVPVLSEEYSSMVSIGTMMAVMLGFGWVCWQLLQTARMPTKFEGSKKER